MTSWKPIPPPAKDFKKDVFWKAGKVSQFIYQIGESPILRQPSIDVAINTIRLNKTKRKITYLKKCLLRYRKITGYGRGITAVQVGIPERFAIIFKSNSEILTIINPKITRVSTTLLIFPEGCMSANPIFVPVIRPAWIELDYYDEAGKLQKWHTKDDTDTGRIMNRVLQHEIDHMDGIINIDRVVYPTDIFLESDPDFYDSVKFHVIRREQ